MTGRLKSFSFFHACSAAESACGVEMKIINLVRSKCISYLEDVNDVSLEILLSSLFGV